MSDFSRWTVELSNGLLVTEDWIDGELSPWQRLMHKCATEKLYVKSICLGADGRLYYGEPNCAGYWSAKASMATQGSVGSSTASGIGWVVGDTLHTIWVGRSDNKTQWWSRDRSPDGQNQIIWSKIA